MLSSWNVRRESASWGIIQELLATFLILNNSFPHSGSLGGNNICKSVLGQMLPYKTRYWPCSGRTWKIWEAGVGTYKHLKSKYNPSTLKLLNIFQHSMWWCSLLVHASPQHFISLVLYLCGSSFVHYFSLLGDLAKQKITPFLPSLYYLLD